MECILFAVFMHENRNQGLATPSALRQIFYRSAAPHLTSALRSLRGSHTRPENL
jgi:hypothetical protein